MSRRGPFAGSARRQRPVVVAVVAVWVVKMAGNAIIYMVAVRHRLVAAAGAVYMAAS